MSDSDIHPTAIIDKGAQLGANVTIGAYSVIGAHVKMSDNVRIDSHVTISGHTSIGARTHIFPFASIGHQPQDLKFAGEITQLEIGTDNRIREHVTINPGTKGGGGITRIGNHGLFMVGAHIAHDCLLGDHVILANNVTLGGHVVIDDFAIIGGLSGIHQFCRIGTGSFVGGASAVAQDVIPYGSVLGNRAVLAGLNFVGLKRQQFERAHIHALHASYKMIFNAKQDPANHADSNQATFQERVQQAKAEYGGSPLVDKLVDFIEQGKGRGYCLPSSSRQATHMPEDNESE